MVRVRVRVRVRVGVSVRVGVQGVGAYRDWPHWFCKTSILRGFKLRRDPLRAGGPLTHYTLNQPRSAKRRDVSDESRKGLAASW